jgi:tellurite resistance protein TerC
VNVTLAGWALTILAILAVMFVDLWIVDRGRPTIFTLKQAGVWVTFYVLLAVAFGVCLLLVAGGQYSAQFFAGYLTEYSLSIDNLFIFYIIMARFAVPRANQHKVLLVGILIALFTRGLFIVIGGAALERFEWLFYLFGLFLIWTALGLLRGGGDDEFKENAVLRWVQRRLPATGEYYRDHLTVRTGGRRLVTPMLIVMVAIGSTDLLFALDSIPAIFGLTKQSYLVFTANAFALMGLRQLYFLLGGLLDRLVYLSKGLAFILAFIGVKLIMDAAHATGFEQVPQVPIWMSLSVIGVAMLVTTVASLIKARRDAAKNAGEPVPTVVGDAGRTPH